MNEELSVSNDSSKISSNKRRASVKIVNILEQQRKISVPEEGEEEEEEDEGWEGEKTAGEEENIGRTFRRYSSC